VAISSGAAAINNRPKVTERMDGRLDAERDDWVTPRENLGANTKRFPANARRNRSSANG
jgi:hypothetical protein